MAVWVWWRRSRRDDYGNLVEPGFADCRDCLKRAPLERRRLYHCGFLDEEEWLDPRKDSGLIVHDEAPYFDLNGGTKETNVCPGYLMRRPELYEVSRARRWADRGLLREFAPEPTEALIEAIDLMDAEKERLNDWTMSKPDKGM